MTGAGEGSRDVADWRDGGGLTLRLAGRQECSYSIILDHAEPSTVMGRGLTNTRAFFERHWLALVFYLACPIIISLPLGIFQAGLGRYMTLPTSVLFWASCWFATWLVSELLLRSAIVILRPWHLLFLALLLIAGLGDILLSPFFIGAISKFCFAIGGADIPAAIGHSRIDLTDPNYLVSLLVSGSYGLFAWCGLRWAYQNYTNNVRDRPTDYPPQMAFAIAGTPVDAAIAPPPSPPSERLLAVLRKSGIADLDLVEAIQAEDHYVRLHLSDGSRLVFCRFADILAELRGSEGLQVHRSFWVRHTCIVEVVREAHSLQVLMTNGLVVPVSQKHQALLRYMLGDRFMVAE